VVIFADKSVERSARVAAFEWACVVGLMATMLAGCGARGAPSPTCLAGAKVAGNGCAPQKAPVHRLPFRDGKEVTVTQAYHGYLTHKQDRAFAVDFRCEPGTPVVATRPGRVWQVKEDSGRGCSRPECLGDSNFVVIDHGDGTYSEYHHLQRFGAVVDEGDSVCAGEVIGLCGNTGYTSGPHLHFAVTDAAERNVPSRMPTSKGRPFGVYVPNKTYVSRNERQTLCGGTSYSSLGRDAFAHRGIVLRKSVPRMLPDRDRVMELIGRYYGDQPKVSVHRKLTETGEWIDECAPTDEKGRFHITVEWPSERFESGMYWFMVTGADAECNSPSGWAWSYKVRLGGPGATTN
jgi:hypothetical protein